MLTTLGQVLLLVTLALLGLIIAKAWRLESTLACLLVGFVAGQSVGIFSFDTGIRAHNLKDLVFFIVLPVLIFEAAWHLKPKSLRRWLTPILTLATLGVLINLLVIGALTYWGLGHPQGFPWLAALLTGAILAATDPVAVISQLKRQQAPEELTTLFEGESLFNDASAVVLFSLFLGFALRQGGSVGGADLLDFLKVFFGGLSLGALLGWLTAIACRFLNRSDATMMAMVTLAFASFYLAEHWLHLSGILAVMASAMVLRWQLERTPPLNPESLNHGWAWLGLTFTSLLFVIMGLVITLEMFTERWLAMVVAILAALAGRLLAVGGCALLLKPVMPLSLAWQGLLVWGGLRGAIAIALVLSLPTELPYWWTIQSMVFGVVLFSLLVQGTTNGLLLRKLKQP
ncbi:cation:proton antiporter [Ferrimonas kyonanensis]|uniref:cation:proton antiporter n=1 Tax=Ferrimonas kyonanensis TaxID=364763 RepID=UPI0004248915|nr:sodium:proton antiporter [Ferrimonas kyonanensis]